MASDYNIHLACSEPCTEVLARAARMPGFRRDGEQLRAAGVPWSHIAASSDFERGLARACLNIEASVSLTLQVHPLEQRELGFDNVFRLAVELLRTTHGVFLAGERPILGKDTRGWHIASGPLWTPARKALLGGPFEVGLTLRVAAHDAQP